MSFYVLLLVSLGVLGSEMNLLGTPALENLPSSLRGVAPRGPWSKANEAKHEHNPSY